MAKVRHIDGKLIYESSSFCEDHKNNISIKMKYCGICGSDLKNIKIKRNSGVVFGHEISGIIDSNNINKKVLEPALIGSKVTVFPIVPCHKCSDCRIGNYRDCRYKKSIGNELPGGFSTEISVPYWNLHFITSELSDTEVALIEPLACAIRLIEEIKNSISSYNSSILIIGDGAMGIMAARILHIRGYSRVTVVGQHLNRLSLVPEPYLKVKFREFEDYPPYDIVIISTDDKIVHEKIHLHVRKNGIIFPQSRIDDRILDKLGKNGIGIGRAFAYFRKDFDEAERLLQSSEVANNLIGDDKIKLKDLPSYIEKGLPKDKGLKFLVDCQ